MNNVDCPRCGKNTITPKQKFRSGKWSTVICPNCQGRMCAQPIVLALLYFILTWNIFFFGYMAIRETSLAYALAMVGGWAILEFFIYYVPFVNLRSIPAESAPKTPE